jgi:CRP-like cAMP-binding protein
MNDALIGLGRPGRNSIRDRVLALRAHAMFEGLDDDGFLLLAEHAQISCYAGGEAISVENEPARAVYLVLDGEVMVSSRTAELTSRRAGDAYGALSLLARARSTAAVAVGKTRLLEVPASAFESALVENYSLLRNTLRVFGSAALRIRGNLPADPDRPSVIDEGSYYSEPRSFVEVLMLLREGLFGATNLDALVDFARCMVDERYPVGALLWSAGDSSTHALQIDAGRVRCTGPDGRQIEVGRGFAVGLMDIWAGNRVHDARAVTPVIAFRIDFESYLALLEMHPEVGLDLVRGFARELLAAGASVHSTPPPR